MATLETQYKNFLKDNPNSNMPFEEWKKVNSRIIKQAIINMMKADEDLGLYDEPKQETLEEAAEKEYPTIHEQYQYDAFIEGAKWQQEKSYSEEDFKLFARQYYREIKLDKSNLLWDDLADKCLEQFKKK